MMKMTIDEAISTLHKMYNYYNDNDIDAYVGFYKEDNDALEIALEIIRKYQKIFDKYEILTASFEDSDSPEVRSKKVDEFCIDTMHGLLGEYYAERIGYETNEKRSD